jgi:hypothetical protein
MMKLLKEDITDTLLRDPKPSISQSEDLIQTNTSILRRKNSRHRRQIHYTLGLLLLDVKFVAEGPRRRFL